MPASSLPWVEWLTTGGLGAALMKATDLLVGVLTGRRKANAETRSVEVKALTDTVEALAGQLEAADSRMDEFGRRLDECREQHEECERGRQEDRREIDSLKSQVDQLMRGEVPTYQPADLRRLARRRA